METDAPSRNPATSMGRTHGQLDAIMRILRERAEDGRIEIADEGVEVFIRDAITRILSTD